MLCFIPLFAGVGDKPELHSVDRTEYNSAINVNEVQLFEINAFKVYAFVYRFCKKQIKGL